MKDNNRSHAVFGGIQFSIVFHYHFRDGRDFKFVKRIGACLLVPLLARSPSYSSLSMIFVYKTHSTSVVGEQLSILFSTHFASIQWKQRFSHVASLFQELLTMVTVWVSLMD